MTIAFLAELVTVAAFLTFFLLAKVFLLTALLAFRLFLGHFNYNATRVVMWIGKAIKNHGNEAFVNIHIGIVAIKVYAAYRNILGMCDIIDLTDNLLRKDMIVLAHAEVEAFHGFVTMFALFFEFLAVFFLVFFVDVKVDGILVIIQETVEVERHHTGDEFLAAHPLQFAENNRQVVVDFFAIDVDMLDTVDMVEELFLTNFLTGRNHTFLERTTYNFFYPLDLALLAQVDEAEAETTLVGATRTTTAVHIGLDVVRKVIVDDMRQLLHVDATSSHVGGHQQLQAALAEMVHYIVAHAL